MRHSVKKFAEIPEAFDPMIEKIAGFFIREGKRERSEKVVRKIIALIDSKFPGRGASLLYLGVRASMRDVGVRKRPKSKKSRRRSSFDVYTPYPVMPARGIALGLRSLLEAARRGPSYLPLWENFALEILEASQGRGEVVDMRFKVNRLARRNSHRLHRRISRKKKIEVSPLSRPQT